MQERHFYNNYMQDRHFHNNCGPTFIRDICEWKNDDFAEKLWRHNYFLCSTGKGITTTHKCPGLMQDRSYCDFNLNEHLVNNYTV